MTTTYSWILFQQHFTKHDMDRKKQGTTLDVGFYNEKGVSEMRTETETITNGKFNYYSRIRSYYGYYTTDRS